MKLLAQDQAALDVGDDEQVNHEDFVAVKILTNSRSQMCRLMVYLLPRKDDNKEHNRLYHVVFNVVGRL